MSQKNFDAFETLCHEYSTGYHISYAKDATSGSNLYRSQAFPSLKELQEAGNLECTIRCNKYCVRTYTVRKYKQLRFFDFKDGHLIVLLDSDLLKILNF